MCAAAGRGTGLPPAVEPRDQLFIQRVSRGKNIVALAHDHILGALADQPVCQRRGLGFGREQGDAAFRRAAVHGFASMNGTG